MDKSNMEQQYMSLTPEVKADLERLAAHSSSEEERKQAQEALKELEERAAEHDSRQWMHRSTVHVVDDLVVTGHLFVALVAS